jgi:predicted metal-dependent enzyme (double-stranded beta helix superfamily)
MTKSFVLDDFISDCVEALAEDQAQLAIRDILERAVSRPAAITATLGEPTGWALDTLYHAPDLTILHFIWPPGVDLFPHDHLMWASIGIYGGREGNTFYRRQGDTIEVSGHKEGQPGDVMLLGRDGIHSVDNPSKEWTAAIHVYGGDFFNDGRTQWDPVTGVAKPYDVVEVKQVLTDAETAARAAGIITG